MPDYDIALGGSIDLRVFAAGNPPLNTNEVRWYGPGSNRREVVTGGRIQLRDSNRRLIIMNVELADGGTYRIEICRNIAGPLSPCVQATTTIELNVLGKSKLGIVASNRGREEGGRGGGREEGGGRREGGRKGGGREGREEGGSVRYTIPFIVIQYHYTIWQLKQQLIISQSACKELRFHYFSSNYYICLIFM